ncbi:Rhodanese-like protein [Dothidotthia symphoricarpi CBS 119687]|uniref:M-phase inducer phosphatase n=1 Tax=Dothidotthia symphoricarpi CBS 119687 TaxID=1392245 RepID=A0A6A6ASF9_9PLEO|nr:Rhodanese-like protein [Dothidotthia symphoricarpi CBS 119687]KAF2134506.1 Rhodanese-like protein [Dothidotthia symphoricarpi CBS 119687]
MEMSSPLAAMHPPPIPGPWGYRRDLPPSKPLFSSHSLGSKNFNFRDMSMRKGGGDYFTLQSIRGSSPTASLAADMSQNLHVDQSPQLATPRRSLFTSSLFQQLDKRVEGTITPPATWEGITTPPIPDSSPCFAPDSMDISPLPHKAPFSFINDRCLPLLSPSPDPSPSNDDDDDMLSPCELPTPPMYPTPGLDIQRPASAVERKKNILFRPSLPRFKNYSTNTVSFKQQENNPLPAFQFGAGCDAFPTTTTPTLDECFASSPPQERRPYSNGSLFTSKLKPFNVHANVSRASGSPLAAVRKPSAPRRSKFRRSLSMFESPGEVMNAKQEKDIYQPSGLQSVMDVDDSPALKLPHFTPNEPESLPRIEHDTLIDVLNGDYDHVYDEKVVIDCRFEYEYNGGHIEGALNFCDKEELAERLFNAPSNAKTLLILHCEYSAHRAPLMAKFVRSHDRKENAHRYPLLTFPEVYILDGGYSSFYHSHATRCFPQNYLRMDAKEHEQSCERGLNKLKQRKQLHRAKTFAFGQHSCQMEDSPTSLGRTRSGNNLFTLSNDSDRIGASRRLASY